MTATGPSSGRIQSVIENHPVVQRREGTMQCPGQNEGRSVTCSRPVNSIVVCVHQHAQAKIGKDCLS
jgi:hypothetical protein